MKKTNNFIPIGKEESCLIFGGRGHEIAEAIGRGLGRFAKRFCRLIKEMLLARDFSIYR